MAERFFIESMKVEHITAVAAIERMCFTQPWPAHAYRREIQENRMAHYLVARQVADRESPIRAQSPGFMDGEMDARAGGGNGAGSTRLPTTSRQHRTATQEPGLLDRLARLLWPSSAPLSPDLEAELRSIVGYAGLWVMADEAHITTIAVHPEFQGRGVGELLLLALIDRSFTIEAKWMTLEVRVSNDVAQALYRKYTFKEMGIRKGYYSDNREDALVMWTERLDSEVFHDAVERNRAKLDERLNHHA